MLEQIPIVDKQGGMHDAFEQIFKITYPRLISYCKLFIKSEFIAEDLVQECFLKLWEKRKSIKESESVESLLFVMLRNRCFNYLRDRKALNSEYITDIDNLNELQFIYQIDFTGREGKSIEEKLMESFKNAIDELPLKRKEVFIKCKIEGEKQKDVAQDLGISIKAVEKHISKAKQSIHSKLIVEFPAFASIIAIILNR